MTVKPRHKWKETYQPIEADYLQHKGKKITVLKDITDPAVLDEKEYGYVRCYRIELENGEQIDALEVEVEDFPTP